VDRPIDLEEQRRLVEPLGIQLGCGFRLRQGSGLRIDKVRVSHRLWILRSKAQPRQNISASADCAYKAGTEELGMSDTSIAIKIAGQDAQTHASAWTSDDETWIKRLSDSEKVVRIRMPADDDTEGHQISSAVTVLVGIDDDDTEGHALRLHFPSAREANDFRRNLMAAGLLTATLAVGAAGGAAIGMAASGVDANQETVVSSQYAPNVGQYDPANMGGTLAPSAGSLGQASLGQADPANMGGTLTPSAGSLGQADPANMGGTPQSDTSDDEDAPPSTPPGI